MLNRTRSQKRLLLVFSLLFALLGLHPAGAAQPLAAVGAGILVDPNALLFTVELGQSSTRIVKLTNTAAQTLSPTIYEAYPAVAPATLAATYTRQAVALPHQAERIDTRLVSAFQAAPDHQADFLIFMREQADLSAANQIHDWNARGRYVYQMLVDQADRSQRDLRSQLATRGLRYHPLWIVNAVLVHGAQADAQALANRQDVALVRSNHISAIPTPESVRASAVERCNPTAPSNPICWNVSQIGADRVWRDFGVTGEHIVVANIDTGVRFDHPALVAQYRGALGGGRFDHNYNWFDPAGQLTAPDDTNSHGTHTMGTMVARGDGTTNRPAVGVAPGARWIAALGCASGFCSDDALIESAQWMLAPTNLAGEQPRPDLRPMVINNSWAGDGGTDWYAGYTAAWRAAGIFPVFAAGNGFQQACGSIDSPGDYADVVAVGATDQNDSIAPFSLFGPSIDGRRKPDFVAPGAYSGSSQAVLSTVPGDGGSYAALQGTSMAAPHVAALVALMWSANPALIGDYDATYALIRDSAHLLSDTRCGDAPGTPNNIYGAGRIDAYAAVARARVDIPWLSATALAQPLAAGESANISVTVDAARVPGPGSYTARLQVFGADLTDAPSTIAISVTVAPASQQATLTGRVISADTGAPIAATVGVKDGLGVQTSSSGTYTLTLAAGTYDIVASAPSFLPTTLNVLLNGDQAAPDIVMQPDQPHIALATSTISTSIALGPPQSFSLPIGNTGTQPLYYKVRVLPDQFAAARSDQPGGPAYAWVDLPPDAPTLSLDDNGYKDDVPLGITFPFASYTLTQTLVTADGTLSFSLPNLPYNGPSNRCLPAGEFYFYMIAPFRADLDPSSGGAIRYGTIDSGTTFVLSYENVPLHSNPGGATYTFQVLLHNDGRIVFQYRMLGALPSALSVGIQNTSIAFQELGCGSTTPIAAGLAITLDPQVLATDWLQTGTIEGQVLPASAQQITGTLTWARSSAPYIQRGRIEITSNDPIRSRIMIPATIDALPPPHEFWLP